MEKAYDLKVLAAYAKEAGIEIAEESAKDLFDVVMKWVKESAGVSENKVDDMIVGVAAPLESWVHEQIDNINPADNTPVA